jgi:inorganic pyrophosphatase
MTNFTKLPTWADKAHIHAVVETPRGSSCKLEFDSKLRVFTLSKPLMAGLTYPYDWGFIPSTKADDGDPVDVLVIHETGTYPGLVMRCRPIGLLEVLQTTERKKNRNDRVFACRSVLLLPATCTTSGIFLYGQWTSCRSFFVLPTR